MVEMRTSINLASLTIEQVLSKRRKELSPKRRGDLRMWPHRLSHPCLENRW